MKKKSETGSKRIRLFRSHKMLLNNQTELLLIKQKELNALMSEATSQVDAIKDELNIPEKERPFWVLSKDLEALEFKPQPEPPEEGKDKKE